MHQVVVVATHGVVAFDLATPLEIFRGVRLADGSAPYRVRVCGTPRVVPAKDFEIRLREGLEATERADTILIPGVDDLDRGVPRELIRALRAAAERGARLASICSGAFVLAATGLLAGKRATTHWLAAAELAKRYPAIDVDANALFVDEGKLLTSAGATAGIDLCLHVVRRDHGAAVAARAARMSVVALEREGGQAQFMVHPEPPDDGGSLAPLLAWMHQNLRRELPLAALARRAAMSTRTLSRRFREQTGMTPAQWVIVARVRRAQELLETTSHPVERVASLAGFESAATLRARFRRVVGTSPRAYRRAFCGENG
ncbi:MAG TPA: helix-turn-helix domain-containing protein [Myxococcota bacterium]|nr:helix-turn-helix domain-containing protein [Myxococcota bacterium]